MLACLKQIRVFSSALFCIGFLASAASQAQTVPCSSLWANGFPEQGFVADAGNCHVFQPAVTSLHSGQQIYFQNESIDSADAKIHLEWAAEALVYSSSKYEAYALLPQIRIVYSPRANPTDAARHAFSFIEFFQLPQEFCPIVIYPISSTLSKDHFYQMIAHEVYHCAQKASFPLQASAAVQGHSQGDFWFEGIAQFMSNEVYPINDFEYHPMFGRFDGHVHFFQQTSPYLTEGFFQSLFWYSGSSPAVIHNLQAAFSTGGATDVQDVLTIPQISEAYHEAARRISFLELNDSSGNLSPWRVEKQFLVVPETPTSVVNIHFVDFGIEPFEISFPRGGQYTISVVRPAGAKLSLRKVNSTLWDSGDFPTNFVSDCNEERKFEGVYTRAIEDMGVSTVRLEIQRRDNPACPCSTVAPPKDVCLFGSWEVDHVNLREFMQKTSNGMMNVTSSSGALKLSFSQDGLHAYDYQNLVVNGSMNAAGQNNSVMWMWNGVNNLVYSDSQTAGQTKICAMATTGTVVTKATMTIDGMTMDLPVSNINFSGQGQLAYTCDATTYKYTVDTGVFQHTWIYNRAGVLAP